MALLKHLTVGTSDYTFNASKLSDDSLAHEAVVTSSGKLTIDGNNVALSDEVTALESKVPILGSDNKIPTTYLPSYVDDVLEYNAKSSFPSIGETGKIYVDTSNNKTYRWSGTAYTEISASLALGTTSSTAYRGDYGNTAYQHAISEHAPVTAEKNQNAFSNIAVSGQTTVAADTTTDTVTFVGSNVTITTDATNDKVTFTVANGSTSAKGVVQLTNSTSSTSTTTAATPNSVKLAYDLADSAKTLAEAAQATADGKAPSTHSHTITANATDGMFDITGTSGTNAVTYAVAPYSSRQTTATGKFDTATSNPTGTTRLNYNGYLYATKLYSGGTEVSVSGHTHDYASATHNHAATEITTGTIAYARLPVGTGSSQVAQGNHTHSYAGSSSAGGAATSANKVNSAITITLNGGTTEGTDKFTFNGSAAKSINITASSIGAAASSHGTHVSYSTTAPAAPASTASAGSASTVSRSDHVHPLQTTVSGNAGTATKFASAQSVALTGDVTGSASSQAGWSITTTLANSGVTAGTYGPSANVTGSNGATITVPQITVDAKGRVTSVTNRTYTSVNTDTNTNYYHTRVYSSGLKISTGTGISDMYVPSGTASQYGVVKPNAVRTSAITAATGGTTSGRYYGVELDSNGKMFVNVPWTDANTTYTFSASNPTLAWGQTSTIGTADGTTYKVTMPANPTLTWGTF